MRRYSTHLVLKGVMDQVSRKDRSFSSVGRLAASAETATSEPGPADVFVGRERELTELFTGLEDSRSGRGRLFLLSGEPGIGKSRLAGEFAAHARDGGARVLWGRCWEAGGAPAYWPWVQLLRAYVRTGDPVTIREEMGSGATDIAQMLPDVHDLFPEIPSPPSVDPESARFQLFDSTARFLTNATAVAPLALVLDDLHAADTPSLLLLRFLAGQLSESRILVLGTYRDVEVTLAAGRAVPTRSSACARDCGYMREKEAQSGWSVQSFSYHFEWHGPPPCWGQTQNVDSSSEFEAWTQPLDHSC